MRARRAVFVLCCAFSLSLGGVSAVIVPAVADPTRTADPVGAAQQPDEASAIAAARTSGTPVEAANLRSETQQVFAQPDGTLQAEVNLLPVRVRHADGSWVPVDTTLRSRPDGTVAPGATPLDMVFSGGGSTPLASMSRSGKSLSLSWMSALPTPVLDGDTATYRDVLPDVDLRVQADVEGFFEQLVVKTPEAAANPALTTVRFRVAANGVVLQSDADGNLAAVDSAGGTGPHRTCGRIAE